MLTVQLIGILFSSLIAGLSGFGYSLIAVPFLLLFHEPTVVVPVAIIHGILLNFLIIKDIWKFIDLKRIYPLMIFGAIGTPIGTTALTFFSPDIVKVITGTLIVIFATILIAGFYVKIQKEKLAFISIGMISGFLNGLTTMSGPPVILFYANQKMKKRTFRANLVIYFLFLNIFTFPVLLASNTYNKEILIYALKLSPGVIIGSLLGIMLVKRINNFVFRKITLLLVLLSGVVTVLTVLLK